MPTSLSKFFSTDKLSLEMGYIYILTCFMSQNLNVGIKVYRLGCRNGRGSTDGLGKVFKFMVVAGTQFLRKIYKIGFIGTTFTYKLFVSIFKGNHCESGMKLLIKRSLDITLVVEGLKVKSPKSVKKV